MLAPEVGDHPPARGPLEEPELQEVRLVDILDRVGLLAERDRERREPDGTAAELRRDRVEQLPVDPLEALLVDLEELECLLRDLGRDRALVPHLGDVAHAAEDPIRDPGRPAGAGGDLAGAGAALATITAGNLPAGTYRVVAEVALTGTLTAAELDNVALARAGSTVKRVVIPNAGTPVVRIDVQVLLTGAQTLSLTAVAAGGVAAVYSGSLTATRIGA